ncbi:hypothetical protein [Vibrio splendidus]|uniref:hypothetical protein n=1 Tax=Vibrio splendidus TaxID=29497 RepID=UPI002469C5FB|nr:hypothetical protein [Vibrio splendidus]MDH5898179.1 hypothetical protein [Vibrio splendidus]
MNQEIKKLLECLVKEVNYSSRDAKLTAYTTAVDLLFRNQQLFDYEPEIAFRGFPLEESEEKITLFSKKCLLIIDKLHGAACGGSRYIYRSKGVRVYLFEDGQVLTVTPYSTIDDDGFQLHNDPWSEGLGGVPRTIEAVEDIIDQLNDPDEFTQRIVSEEMINILCSVKEKYKRSYCLEYVLTPSDVNNLSSFSKKVREELWNVIFSVDNWSEDELNLCIDYLLKNEINPLPYQLLSYISKISKSVNNVQQLEELFLNLEQRLCNKIEESVSIDNLFNYFNQQNLESPSYLLLNTTEKVKSVVSEILTQFKDLVENKGLWKQFWNGDSTPRNEHSAQEIFCSVAHSFCKANNIDLSPEANFGNGPVDFKFSSGYHSKVVVEMKLSTNPRIVHGYEKQLEVYKNAESTKHGVLLIIDVGGMGNKYEKVLQLKQEYPLSEVWYVDATRKASASKRI